jgi:DNA-binding response OmpR family regulator
VITKALAKSRDDRYSTCGELVRAFAEAIQPGTTPPGGHQPVHGDGEVPRMLLVTADPGTSLTVEAALRRSRMTLVQVATAEAAYEKAVAEPPDLVLIDAGLPDGDALELCQKLRSDERTRRGKLVLLTNPHAKIDMGAAAQVVDDYLAYPFPPLQLFNTVREYIPEAFGESAYQ